MNCTNGNDYSWLLLLLLTILITACNICSVHTMFVQLFDKTYVFEFKVNITTTDVDGHVVSNTEDYLSYYKIDNFCTNYNEVDENYKLKINFNTSTYIYADFNYNLRFMLKIQIKSTDTSQNSISGYEIVIFGIPRGSSISKATCIRIIERKPIENSHKRSLSVQKTFELIIKDPPLLGKPVQINSNKKSPSDEIKYNFYFGGMSVNALKRCSKNSELDNMCSIVFADSKFVDVGIEKGERRAYDEQTILEIYKERYDDCITNYKLGCIQIKNLETDTTSFDGKRMMTFIHFHKIDPNVLEMTSWFGITQSFHENIVSYQDELVNKLAFKIIDNFHEFRATQFMHMLNNTKMSSDMNCANDEFCVCNNQCTKCPERHLEVREIFVKNGFTVRLCDADVYKYIDFTSNKYKTTFLGHKINNKNEIHLYDSYPKLCYLIKYTKNTFDRNSGTQLREIIIKLQDQNGLTYNKNFETKYQILLHKFCRSSNRTEAVSSVLFNETIDEITQPIILSELILPGHYAIEIIPTFNSNYCSNSLCPYQNLSRKIDSHQILCEKCKKILYYINIRKDTGNMVDYKCLDSKYDESFDHMSSANGIFSNASLLVDSHLKIVRETNNICPKIDRIVVEQIDNIKSIIFHFLILIGSLLVFVLMFIICVLLISVYESQITISKKVLIILPKDVDELPEELKKIINLILNHLRNINFKVLKLCDAIEIEYVLNLYDQYDEIFYYCNNETEIEMLHTFDSRKMPIGQDFDDAAKCVLLERAEYKNKLHVISFYQQDVFSNLKNFQFDHYELPDEFDKLLETLMLQKNANASSGCISKLRLKMLYSKYIKHKIKAEYKRTQKRKYRAYLYT